MKVDMTISEINTKITDALSNMPGDKYWKRLDYAGPGWNEYIIMAQREGIDAVVDLLNSTSQIDEAPDVCDGEEETNVD